MKDTCQCQLNEDLEKVLGYLYRTEMNHYEESGRPDNHIFAAVCRLRKFYGMGKEVKQMGKTKGLANWVGVEFESSTGLTQQFAEFAKEFKANIKEKTQDLFSLEGWNRGHFYISGFLRNNRTGKYVYFSISDVRHFPDGWHNNVLVRTAKDIKDFTGGPNNYCSLAMFRNTAEALSA